MNEIRRVHDCFVCCATDTAIGMKRIRIDEDHGDHHSDPIEPPRPLGAWLLDQLLFLSPRTWWGLLLLQLHVPFAPLDLKAMVQNMVGIIMPLLVISAALQWLNDSSVHPNNLLHFQNQIGVVSSYMLSPWTIACAVELLGGLRKVGLRLHNYQARRMPPLPEAVTCLQQRVENGRAIRYRRFDVYLPTKVTATVRTSPSARAILFLPGSSVSHVAYSPVAARLSDEGFMVVVLSMEPWRMAYHHLGADESRLGRIQKVIRRQMLQGTQNKNNNKNATNIVWVLMGHSMGSFAAMRLAANLWKPKQSTSFWRQSSTEIPDQLVMWAAASFPGWTTPLPPSNGGRVKVLVIQGSRDAFYLSTLPHRSGFLKDFSESASRHVTIRGANHANFGHFSAGKAAATLVKRFDEATISRQKQQTLACRLTAQFLKQSKL